MSKKSNELAIVIGGEPRVNLLPPEIITQAQGRSMRRNLIIGVIAALAVMVLATGGANLYALQAKSQVDAAQSKTQALLVEQAKYSSVRTVQADIALVKAAQQVGASTEIDWKSYLDKVQATMPAGTTLQGTNVVSASPLAALTQPTVPLQGPRVAEITLTATSPSVDAVSTWLANMQSLPGFTDATSSLGAQDGGYGVTITLHVGEAAFDGRFAAKAGN